MLELDPEREDGRVFEPADHPVNFALAIVGLRVLGESELGVGFGFEDEGADLLRRVFVGCRERGEGAGEVGKVILYDTFDGGG